MRRAAVCALAGAALTVVIAWGLALLPYPLSWVLTEEVAPHTDPAYVDVDRTRFGVEEAMRLLPKEEQKASYLEREPPWWSRLRRPGWRERRLGAEFAAGWPMRCLYAYSVVEDTTRPSKFKMRACIRLRSRFGSRGLFQYALPLQPLWPGFLVNSAFYGAGLFALWTGAVEGRGALRRRRGECPRCRYDLSGGAAAGCPECGCGRV